MIAGAELALPCGYGGRATAHQQLARIESHDGIAAAHEAASRRVMRQAPISSGISIQTASDVATRAH